MTENAELLAKLQNDIADLKGILVGSITEDSRVLAQAIRSFDMLRYEIAFDRDTYYTFAAIRIGKSWHTSGRNAGRFYNNTLDLADSLIEHEVRTLQGFYATQGTYVIRAQDGN